MISVLPAILSLSKCHLPKPRKGMPRTRALARRRMGLPAARLGGGRSGGSVRPVRGTSTSRKAVSVKSQVAMASWQFPAMADGTAMMRRERNHGASSRRSQLRTWSGDEMSAICENAHSRLGIEIGIALICKIN